MMRAVVGAALAALLAPRGAHAAAVQRRLPAYAPDGTECIADFNICFALDESGSVSQSNFDNEVENFAVAMATELHDVGGVVGASVVEFATSASITSPLTTDEAVTVDYLRNDMVYSGGWTHHREFGC